MDEFFTLVSRRNPCDPSSEILIGGCVTRDVAHSHARVPHATVQIIPVCSGTGIILIHQRPGFVRNSPNRWDILGGHVTFEMGILSSSDGLAEASKETALREAREEILVTVNGHAHLIMKSHLQQIGKVGQFEWGVKNPRAKNVEYSTAFVLCLPRNATVATPFELRDGSVLWLPTLGVSWDQLQKYYENSKSFSPSSLLTEEQIDKGVAAIVSPDFQSDLDDNQVSANLSEALIEFGIPLSENTEIFTFEQGGKWIVVDAEQIYAVHVTDKLYFYQGFADGVGRILEQISSSLQQKILEFISKCDTQENKEISVISQLNCTE